MVNEEKLTSSSLPLSSLGTMTWNELFPGKNYSELICDDGNSLPNASICIPTGGGKTIIGLFSSIRLLEKLERDNDFIVWMVPSDAIYQQVLKDFSSAGKYYSAVSTHFGKTINLLTKSSVWTDSDLESTSSITILLLGKGAMIRDEVSRGDLLVYRNPDKVSSLSVLSNELNPSLFALMKIVQPVFVIDESHKIYTQIGRDFFRQAKVAKFMVELSATPKSYDEVNSPNVIFSATGSDLIEEQLIKNPISYHATVGIEPKQLIQNTIKLQEDLELKLENQGIPIIPRVLISAEFTGRAHENKPYSASAIKGILMELGVTEDQILIKSSENDELGSRDLDSNSDPAKYILTKTALMEGWDCKSVYILVLLNNISAPITNFQIVGRGLRQPFKTYFNDPSINTLYVLTNSERHDESLNKLIDFLGENGLANLEVKSNSSQNIHSQKMEFELSIDPWVNYLDFNFDYYDSVPFRLEVEKTILEHTEKIVSECNSYNDAEAIRISIDLKKGTAGTIQHQVLSEKNNELFSETGIGRLRQQLFVKLIKNFVSSSASLKVATAICEDLMKNQPSIPSEQALIEKAQGIVSNLRRNFIKDQFSELLKNKSKVLSGPISKFFGSNFVAMAEQDAPHLPSFSNCLLGNMPKSLFNGQELDFARFLDNKVEILWMKTTPGFKINFPYPLGAFYPDFVIIPKDNEAAKKTTFFVETKGAHILTSEDSSLKRFACQEISNLSNDKLNMIFGSFEECEEVIRKLFSNK